MQLNHIKLSTQSTILVKAILLGKARSFQRLESSSRIQSLYRQHCRYQWTQNVTEAESVTKKIPYTPYHLNSPSVQSFKVNVEASSYTFPDHHPIHCFWRTNIRNTLSFQDSAGPISSSIALWWSLRKLKYKNLISTWKVIQQI